MNVSVENLDKKWFASIINFYFFELFNSILFTFVSIMTTALLNLQQIDLLLFCLIRALTLYYSLYGLSNKYFHFINPSFLIAFSLINKNKNTNNWLVLSSQFVGSVIGGSLGVLYLLSSELNKKSLSFIITVSHFEKIDIEFSTLWIDTIFISLLTFSFLICRQRGKNDLTIIAMVSFLCDFMTVIFSGGYPYFWATLVEIFHTSSFNRLASNKLFASLFGGIGGYFIYTGINGNSIYKKKKKALTANFEMTESIKNNISNNPN